MSKKILIVGGGYGGLNTAIRLQKRHANADITLISKHDYHYQTTLLHKVAIGTLSDRKAKIYYRDILDLERIKFIKDKVMEIHPKENYVLGKLGKYDYDILVIALGFKPDDFGIPGVKEHAFKLSSFNAAARLNHHIERKLKDYHIRKDDADLSFIVCGAGLTSIEFAAELANERKKLCKYYGLDENLVKITVVGRNKNILPVFDQKLIKKATEKLKNMGITLLTGASVKECQADGVLIERNNKEEFIRGHTILWGSGVKGNDTVEYYSNDIQSHKGRIKVTPQLKSVDYDNIYVVGDCAIYAQREVVFVPTAQLATQMGDYIGNLLSDKLEGKTKHKDFKFINRGSVCSIGHLDAVGVVFGRKISGEFGAFMKNLIENRWLFTIGGLRMIYRKGQFRYRRSD